jgi:8-oxo-dGTP diphosphatase
LRVPFTYPYPRPAVTCDAVVFTMRGDDLAVLLIRRKEEPFRGLWALPGGYVNENESLDRAAARELAEETGISSAKLEQIGAFGDPGRDPRGHTVTIAWLTFLVSEPKVTAGDDAAAAEWHAFRTLALDGGPTPRSAPVTKARAKARTAPRRTSRSGSAQVRLAFDHAKILARAYRRLCQHLDDPVRDRAFDLLPSRFTLAEVQHFYEVVLGRSLPQRSFKKNLLDQGLVVPATSKPTRKPADQLYRWNRR